MINPNAVVLSAYFMQITLSFQEQFIYRKTVTNNIQAIRYWLVRTSRF